MTSRLQKRHEGRENLVKSNDYQVECKKRCMQKKTKGVQAMKGRLAEALKQILNARIKAINHLK